MSLFRNELFKIYRRNELKVVIVSIAIIPILISIMIKTGSEVISMNGLNSSPMFAIGLWALLRLLMITYIVPIFSTATNLGKEMDEHIIEMYLTRYERVKYYCTKQWANIIYISNLFFLYLISCFIAFNIFIKGSNTAEIGIDFDIYILYYSIFLSYLELVLLSLVSHSLATKFGGIGSGIITTVGVIILNFSGNNKILTKFLPTSLTDISRILDLKSSEIANDLTKTVLILGMYGCLFFFFGGIYFKKKDIS